MRHLLLFSFSDFIHDNKTLLIVLIVGAIAGLIAQLITPGRGFGLLATIAIGIAGGWLGNKLFKDYLSWSDSAFVNAIVTSTAGALILCILINLVFGKSKKDHDRSDYESGR